MNFIQFCKITNSYDSAFLAKVMEEFGDILEDTEWVVHEKIHGANYSFWCNQYGVTAGKRNGFIGKDEKFFNHVPVFNRYSKNIYNLSTRKRQNFVVFGELFGGKYEGKESSDSSVQKEVQYSPQQDFLAFEICNAKYNTIEYYDYDRFVEMCQEFGIPYAPALFRGGLSAALDHGNQFITKIPELYGLEPLPDNFCEGVVIKPVDPLFLKDGRRVVFKSKNDIFKESTTHTSQTQPSLTGKLLDTVNEIRKHITKNRLDAVYSKHGESVSFGQLIKDYYTDILEEVGKDKYDTLSKEEKSTINRVVNKDMAKMVREKLFAR